MATSHPVSRPDRALAANKRAKYVDTGEASRMLDGLISAGVLRQMALRGEIRDAIKVRTRVLIPRYIVPTLVKELFTPAALLPRRRDVESLARARSAAARLRAERRGDIEAV
jgi:hypothetical protein